MSRVRTLQLRDYASFQSRPPPYLEERTDSQTMQSMHYIKFLRFTEKSNIIVI